MVRRRTQPGDGHFVGAGRRARRRGRRRLDPHPPGHRPQRGRDRLDDPAPARRSRLRHRGRAGRAPPRLRALRPAPHRGQPRRPQRPLRRPLRAPRHAPRGAPARRLLVQGHGGPTPTSTPSSARSGAGSPDPPHVRRLLPSIRRSGATSAARAHGLWRMRTTPHEIRSQGRLPGAQGRRVRPTRRRLRPWRPGSGCCSCWPVCREPQVNLTVRDERGEVVRKYDLSYPEVKVAGGVQRQGPRARPRGVGEGPRAARRGRRLGVAPACPSSAPASTARPSRPSGASTVSCSPAACRAYLSAWATAGGAHFPGYADAA